MRAAGRSQLGTASLSIRHTRPRTGAVRLQERAQVPPLAQAKGPGHARPEPAAHDAHLQGGMGEARDWGEGRRQLGVVAAALKSSGTHPDAGPRRPALADGALLQPAQALQQLGPVQRRAVGRPVWGGGHASGRAVAGRCMPALEQAGLMRVQVGRRRPVCQCNLPLTAWTVWAGARGPGRASGGWRSSHPSPSSRSLLAPGTPRRAAAAGLRA